MDIVDPRFRPNPIARFLDNVAMILAISMLLSIGVLIADAAFGQSGTCPAPKHIPIVGELPHVES